MSTEVRPFGVKCNIQCQYCYQNPQRDAGNIPHEYDIEKMKLAIEMEGGDFVLFGGEPLMMPIVDLERLWSWGFEKYKKNGVQTNGVLINDTHIRLFKEYQVQVGLSVDGPDELNDIRWAGSLKRTREATAKTHASLKRLCKEGIPPSLIVTLHRGNATADKLPIMNDWFRSLDSIGVKSVRLHVLEIEHGDVRDKYSLSIEENLQALECFAQLEQEELKLIKFDLFRDLRKLLLAQDNHTTCVWNACDPYTTRAVRGVEGNGQRSNCGRTNKDGIDFVKSTFQGFERYIALYHTPQEYGGCKGCKFFLTCKGQCPGTAIGGDWRNRTEYCELWKKLFQRLETEIINKNEVPLSEHPDRQKIEEIFLHLWAMGRNPTIEFVLHRLSRAKSETSHQVAIAMFQATNSRHGDSHGDHEDFGH